MKISFLLHNRYGIGGAITSTLNLAGALAERHTVEIVSTRRDRDRPALPLDPRVTVRDLTDVRENSPAYDGDEPLAGRPARIYPKDDATRAKEIGRLTELRLGAYLAETDADVIVATNPGLAVCLAAMGTGPYTKVVQEHQALSGHSAALRKRLAAAYSSLHAVVPVSREDAENARRAFAHTGARVQAIPNCVPQPPIAPSDGSSKTVVAAGRLVPGKQFEHLIRAFAVVAHKHPDWTLRIFGSGPERARLLDEIARHGITDNVLLMGASSGMQVEWAKAAVAASSSRAEALPMNLIEAMHAGVPVVSTDCDFGPREIVRPGTDGLLTPVGDVDALASALLRLIDDELRRGMGQAARERARRYLPAGVAAEYDALFEQLRVDRSLPSSADWWVADNLDIVVRVTAPELAGRTVRLVCVPRPGGAATEPVSFPFRAADAEYGDGVRHAVLPHAECQLPEGHWDLYVETEDGRARRRLGSGLCDDRNLLHGAAPGATGPALRSRIPYATDEGGLSLRTWVRDRHAEAARVRVADGAITVDASLWGARLSSAAVVLATSRQREDLDFSVPAYVLSPHDFRFTVPCRTPAGRRATAHDIWDLYVQASAETPPVRIGRLTGDYLDKKYVHQYPLTVLEDTPRGRSRVRPFYTVNSELSVNAVDLAPSGA